MMTTNNNSSTERRIWVGSLHLYNAGFLIGEWFDIDECTLASEIEDQAKEYIEEHLPEGEDLDESIEELWCFDQEGIPVDGECGISEAVDAVADLYRRADELGHDVDTLEAVENAGYTVDSHTILYHLSDGWSADHLLWYYLAEQLGMTDEAGRFADYVDWEQMLKYDFSIECINDSYYAIQGG